MGYPWALLYEKGETETDSLFESQYFTCEIKWSSDLDMVRVVVAATVEMVCRAWLAAFRQVIGAAGMAARPGPQRV
jgi:hypothetical protein